MENKVLSIKKRTFVFVVFLASVLVLSGLVVAVRYTSTATFDRDTVAINLEKNENLVALKYTCPKQKGTCTAGTHKCVEDLGLANQHACEYSCGAGGKWGAGVECDMNLCYGARCNENAHIIPL